MLYSRGLTPYSGDRRIIRRILGHYKVDKVVFVKKGMYLVRFNAMKSRDKVLAGHFFFDNKPMMMKDWFVDMDRKKEEVKTLSI